MLIGVCFNSYNPIVLQFILDCSKYASMESISKIPFLTKTCCFDIVVLDMPIIVCCQCVESSDSYTAPIISVNTKQRGSSLKYTKRVGRVAGNKAEHI